MNKAELVEIISDRVDLHKTKVNEVIDLLTTQIVKALKSGERVTIVGFGSFTLTDRSERKGRNPYTGESIEIDAKKVVRFKPGKELIQQIDSLAINL